MDPSGERFSSASADLGTLVALLKTHDIFASMDEQHLQNIAEACPIEDAAAGTVLFRQGDPGSFAYLLVSGELSVDVDTPHGDVTLAVLTAPDMVGEISVFARSPRTATVRTRSAVQLLRLDRDVVRGLLIDHPDAILTIIGALGNRLQGMNGAIATLTQAAESLGNDAFQPAMLETLKAEAGRLGQFAHVFDKMAREIREKSAQREEMRMAAKVQCSFLPSGIDPGAFGDNFEIAASMTPAKDVGGDFYDYFMVGESKLGFAIGDVCGKGMPAAMFMSVSRMILKTLAREGHPPGTVITRLNDVLADDNPECMFVTLFYGCLDLETGMLSYSSAGHEDVYWLGSCGNCERVESLGPIAGVFENTDYPTRTRQIAPGDGVLLVTDGVTEALNPNGELYGHDRLKRFLETSKNASALDWIETLTAEVSRFAAEAAQSDDITCLAMIFQGSEAE
ncbi:PP2C family protein-serine/threonine phosphatase [Roseibium alexandrii]|jgi:serine phosphatase RsbU (regulator of sigma subunit)|uniref:Phosphoserine phosphatase RsbU n=1 Tax=Roseibium alexandrii TaxID=388408 RepID=A0A0M7ADP1_9HYPH|nr:SpoIIE family protein phosphatase [Roseibium alexandrii]CTQ72741.1 Phosphoserine phosphatase RsbU [Roseibium alexandrii]